MYYRSGTGRRYCIVPADAACVFMCMKWRHGRHVESMMSYEKPTPSIDAYLRTWRTILPISSWSDLKWRSLRLYFLKTVTPTRRRKTKWVAIWDQFLIWQYQGPSLFILTVYCICRKMKSTEPCYATVKRALWSKGKWLAMSTQPARARWTLHNCSTGAFFRQERKFSNRQIFVFFFLGGGTPASLPWRYWQNEWQWIPNIQLKLTTL